MNLHSTFHLKLDINERQKQNKTKNKQNKNKSKKTRSTNINKPEVTKQALKGICKLRDKVIENHVIIGHLQPKNSRY